MNTFAKAAENLSSIGGVLGLATVILGVMAIAAPPIAGVGATLLVGVLLLAAGITRLFHAFKAETFGRGVLVFLLGGLSVVGGALIIAKPMLGMISLTMVLAVFFAADGIVEIIAAFKAKPKKGWGWMTVSGIASIVLAGLIIYQWPVSGVWAIGILVGVRLIIAGWSMIILGAASDAVYTEAMKKVAGKKEKEADISADYS